MWSEGQVPGELAELTGGRDAMGTDKAGAKSRGSGEIRNLKTVRGALRINDRSIQAGGIAEDKALRPEHVPQGAVGRPTCGASEPVPRR